MNIFYFLLKKYYKFVVEIILYFVRLIINQNKQL